MRMNTLTSSLSRTQHITNLTNYVNGKSRAPIARETLPVTNPSIGTEIATVPLSSAQDVDDAVRTARAAFPAWSSMPIKERSQVFFRYKTLMEKHAQELAALVQQE